MKRHYLILIIILFFFFKTIYSQVTYTEIFPNISFEYPVEILSPDDNSNRMFIVEQRGRIKVFNIDENVSSSDVNLFLDITSNVSFSEGQEIGLLGLAFHPNYVNNGYFYVFYTTSSPVQNVNTRIVLSRFKVSANINQADLNSELVLFEFDKNQINSNHNGGKIAFGPDSYLYISFGDGGGANDPMNNAQNKENVFGSICRIDVDLNGDNPTSSNGNYEIPSDNPYVNTAGLDIIYALGLRNTWKFSFDNVTNRLWAADVGQGSFEEINIIEKGMNLGWSRYEANTVVDNSINIVDDITFPIHFYNHDQGDVSITGGYIYRGSDVSSLNPSIYNKYIYGDFASGRVWALTYNETTGSTTNELIFRTNGRSISSFGIDNNNEIYFTNYTSNAKIHKLIDGSSAPAGNAVNGFGFWESLNNDLGNGVINSIDIDINGNAYVAGNFSQIGNLFVDNIAVWNKSSGWSKLGNTGANGIVNCLKVAENGNVYAGGTFSEIDGVSANSIAVWNGSQWSQVGSGVEGVVAAIEIDRNNGIYIGGIFKTIDNLTVNNIAYFNGSWSSLPGSLVGLNNEVRSLEIDSNDVLYVGGNFDNAGGISANRIATWDGVSWGALGTGTTGFVEAIIASDTDVFIGGNFASAGGKNVNRIARFSKSSSEFFPLDNGLSNNVTSLILNEDHLYAAGSFEIAFNNSENIIVNGIARWSNNGWEALGSNTNVGVDIKINTISFLPSTDQQILAGGNFSMAGTVDTKNIALWNSENILSVDENQENSFLLFPNPTFDTIEISKELHWSLYNSFGKKLKVGFSKNIDMMKYSSGLYFIKIKNGNSYKVIKQ